MYIHYTHKNMASRILKKINRPDGKECLKNIDFQLHKKTPYNKSAHAKKNTIIFFQTIKFGHFSL